MINVEIELVSDCLHVVLGDKHSLRSSETSISGVRDSVRLDNSTWRRKRISGRESAKVGTLM
jgi:hypothetical protein